MLLVIKYKVVFAKCNHGSLHLGRGMECAAAGGITTGASTSSAHPWGAVNEDHTEAARNRDDDREETHRDEDH